MINSDVVQIQKLVENLKKEIIELKRKTKNIPMLPASGGGISGAGRVVLPHGTALPSPQSFCGANDSIEAKLTIIKNAPEYYCADTRAWYRLVLNEDYELAWASVTMIRIGNTEKDNVKMLPDTNIPPGSLLTVDKGYNSDIRLYHNYAGSPLYPGLIDPGCISHADYWGDTEDDS